MSAIRVSEKTHSTLQALARDTGTPMAEIVEAAIEAYRRQQVIAAINAGYTALRADPPAWTAYQAELRAWDATLHDGLEREYAPRAREVS